MTKTGLAHLNAGTVHSILLGQRMECVIIAMDQFIDFVGVLGITIDWLDMVHL